MTNSNEKESSEQNPVKADVLKQSKCTRYSNDFIARLTLCIVTITSLIIAIYSVNVSNQTQQHLAKTNQVLITEIKQLKTTQLNSQQQADSKTDEINRLENDLKSKIDLLNKELKKAMAEQLYQDQDWLLQKARYYLELAQINAHWSDNYNETIALLEATDTLLNQSNATKVFTIRQAIAKEIAQLKAIPIVDIVGLLSQLDALQSSINQLPIQSRSQQDKSLNQDASTSTSKTATWQNHFKHGMSLLEKLIIVRRNDERINLLISPLYEPLLRESIRVNLQEAQWAVLHKNPNVYQLALKQCVESITKIFSQTDSTAALLKQLSELQQIQLTREKPDIGAALSLLNQLINNKESLQPQIKIKGETE